MIIHDNIWCYGRVLTIVLAEGKAMCRVRLVEDGEAWLEGLITHESIRDQHYGTQLLNAACQEAKKLGCNSLWLLVDAPDWVQKWYERNGFVVHHYEFEGLAVMVKKIQ